MDILLKVGLLAVGVYAGVVGAMYVLQRKLMYFPTQALPALTEVGAADMQAVQLRTADGLELVAWYKPATSGAEIIYFHGNGGNISHRTGKIRPLLQAGHGVLLVSYRGYGGNPGSPTEAGLIADGRAAYDFLRQRKVPPERIALIGESLGSGVAVALAAEREVAAVMLEAPFTSAADVGQRAYPWLPVRWLIKDRFDSLSRLRRIDAPLLIVHGENDGVVPAEFGHRLLEAAAEPKQGAFLAGGGHGNLEVFGLLRYELDFLARHVER